MVFPGFSSAASRQKHKRHSRASIWDTQVLWILREYGPPRHVQYTTDGIRVIASLKRLQRCVVSSERGCLFQNRKWWSWSCGCGSLETFYSRYYWCIGGAAAVLYGVGRFFLFPRRCSPSSPVSSADRRPATSSWACVRQDAHHITCGILSSTWHPSSGQILMSKTLKHYFLFQNLSKRNSSHRQRWQQTQREWLICCSFPHNLMPSSRF